MRNIGKREIVWNNFLTFLARYCVFAHFYWPPKDNLSNMESLGIVRVTTDIGPPLIIKGIVHLFGKSAFYRIP